MDPIQIYGLRLWRDHLRIRVDVVLMEDVSVTVLDAQLPADPDAAAKAQPIQSLAQADTAAIRSLAVKQLKARRKSVAGHLEAVASGAEEAHPSVMRLAALLLLSDNGPLVPSFPILRVDPGVGDLMEAMRSFKWPEKIPDGSCGYCGAQAYEWHKHGCKKHARDPECEACRTDHLPGCTLEPNHINRCAVPARCAHSQPVEGCADCLNTRTVEDLFGPVLEETDPAKAQLHQRIKEITENAVCEFLCGDGTGHQHGCARHIKSRTCEECM